MRDLISKLLGEITTTMHIPQVMEPARKKPLRKRKKQQREYPLLVNDPILSGGATAPRG